MPRTIAGLALCFIFLFDLLTAQVDRTKMPPPAPAPAVAFPSYDIRSTSNGIRVIVVENHTLPTLSIRLLIDRKPISEGVFAGSVDLMGEALRTGTTTKTKDQLDEEIDNIGATIGSTGTSLYASGLSRTTEALFALTADIVLHPAFPKDELDKLVTRTVSALKARKSEPEAIVELLRAKLLFGERHPYGEVENEATVGRVTPEKCRELYNAYFRPNAAILAVVGDVKTEQVVALVEQHFGTWQQGPIPAQVFETPPAPAAVRVALVDRPGAPQSVLRFGHTVVLPYTSSDVIPVAVMNTILGGGSAFRLFMNLREQHAFTYGAYSRIGPDELVGSFVAQTSVKSTVTDSALAEIVREVQRIKDEKVGEKELQMAKNYLSGSFVRSLENPGSIAGNAITIERFKLPATYYKDYLKNIEAVSADDVQRVARAYLAPEKALVAVVGPSKEIKAKLAAWGPVTMYDEEANPIVEKPLVSTLKADEIFARFIEKTGGKTRWAAVKNRTAEYSGKIQNLDVKVTSIQQAPNKVFQQMEVPGMFRQLMGFDGKNGWTVSPQGQADLSGDQLEAVKEEAVINFYDHYRKMGFSAQVSAMKSIKGKECYEVTFTRKGKGLLRHYFDAEAFLKVREVKTVTTPQGSVEQSSDFSDYRDFGGYLVPGKIEQSAMGQAFTLTLEKFEVNKGVDEKIFKKPPPPKR